MIWQLPDPQFYADWRMWASEITKILREDEVELVVVPSYTVATLPAPASVTTSLAYVSDEVGGGVLAFSDGTNWRRSTDRAVVS